MLEVFGMMKEIEKGANVLETDYGEMTTDIESGRLTGQDDINRLEFIQNGQAQTPDYVMSDYFSTPSERAIKSQGERGSYFQRKANFQKNFGMTPEQEETMRTALKKQKEMGIGEAFATGIKESTIPSFFDKEPFDNYLPVTFWKKSKDGFKLKEFTKDMSYMAGRALADLPITFGFMGAARAIAGKQALRAFIKSNPGVILTPEIRKAISQKAGGEIFSNAVAFGGTSALNTIAQMEMMQKKRDMQYAKNVLENFFIGLSSGAVGTTLGQMGGQFTSRLMPNAGKALRTAGMMTRVTTEGAISDTLDAGLRGLDLTPEERLLSLATGAMTFGAMEGFNKATRKAIDYTAPYRQKPEGFSDAEINTQIARLSLDETSKAEFIENVSNKIVEKSMGRAKNPDDVYNVAREKAVDAVFENPELRDVLKNNPDMEESIINKIDEGIRSKIAFYTTGKQEKMAFNQVANAFLDRKSVV